MIFLYAFPFFYDFYVFRLCFWLFNDFCVFFNSFFNDLQTS